MRKVEIFVQMWVGICMALACLINPIPTIVAAAVLPPGFSESVVFSGLTEPTVVRFSPDGRVFVAEKSGLIKVFSNLSDTTPTVFHDLRTNVHNYWDRGLLGLALHPNFPIVPEVYVLYTYDKDPNIAQFPRWGTPGATSDGCPSPPGPTTYGCVVSGRLSRLKAVPSGPRYVSDGSEQVLIQGWNVQYPSHTIGTIQFGPDGALYASGGDGADFTRTDYGGALNGTPNPLDNPLGDPPGRIGEALTPPTSEGGATRSQSLRRVSGPVLLNGTIIRVDPSSGAALPNNPLFGNSDANARRIVGYGLRNPFRFTLRPGTNEVWVGDVGRNTWEEINWIPDPLASSVRNFGWPCYEGSLPESKYDALNLNICETLYAQAGGHSAPYFAYRHDQAVVVNDTCNNSGSSSITGLAFNESSSYPAEYNGALFFADYSRNCIWAMFAGANGLPDPARRATFVANAAAPVHLQIGPDGDLFYVDLTGGSIRRIRFSSGNQSPQAIMTAIPTAGPAPLNVAFSSAGSSDPDGDPVTYSWNFGDGGTSIDANPSHTYTRKGPFTAVLTVTDSKGASGTAQVIISPGNSKPTAVIDTPASTTQWKVDQSITFTGHATDPENGTLPPSAFKWELIMHHCPSNCHTHSVQSFSGITTGSFSAPDHEYPSHLELKLTVTDAEGLTDTKSVMLNPQTVALTFNSIPSQLQLVVGDIQSPTPFTTNVILGSAQSLSAVTPQALGSTNYKFVSWSDGGTQSHNITANAAKTYTATYEATSDPVPSPPPSDNGGGGGCTINRSGTGDALLPLLFLTVVALLLLRGKRHVYKG
ncbi:MAG: PQQ-dependent sugar dehydrogenase [Nitrospira sp.]